MPAMRKAMAATAFFGKQRLYNSPAVFAALAVCDGPGDYDAEGLPGLRAVDIIKLLPNEDLRTFSAVRPTLCPHITILLLCITAQYCEPDCWRLARGVCV